MIVGSISENKDLEKRISITPDIAKKYIANGFQILLESGYGSHLGISDEDAAKMNVEAAVKAAAKDGEISEDEKTTIVKAAKDADMDAEEIIEKAEKKAKKSKSKSKSNKKYSHFDV